MVLNDWLGLLSPSARVLPRFSALAAAVLGQAADLAAVAEALSAAYSLTAAEGAQLDALGNSLGISREELPDGSASTDEAYRGVLLAKLSIWRWNGTNETLPAALAEAFPGQTVRMTDNGDLTVTATGSVPENAAAVLPVPAGVRLIT